MWEQVTNDDVLTVIEDFALFRQVGCRDDALIRFKKYRGGTRIVFDFARYMATKNEVWQPIDETLYYVIPTRKTQIATFAEFVEVIRFCGCEMDREKEKKLNRFLRNCTQQFRDFYMLVLTKEEWLPRIFRHYFTKEMGCCVKTKDVYPLKPYLMRKSQGVIGLIESVWEEDGEPKGYNVWHRGRILQCGCVVPPMYLYMEIVRGVPVRFSLRTKAVHEILFGTPPFSWGGVELSDGSFLRVEKCLRCLSHTDPRSARGICHTCLNHLNEQLDRYGADTWMPISNKRKRRWEKEKWDWQLLNKLRLRIRGHIVRCRRDGAIMFVKENLNGETIKGQGETRPARVPRTPWRKRLDVYGVAGGSGGGRPTCDFPRRKDFRRGSKKLPAD